MVGIFAAEWYQLLAVCENHFCVNPAVLCADKLHACWGQRIECRDTLCALCQNKGVVGGVIGRCRFVQQVIGCHVGVGAYLQQDFKLRTVRMGFQLGGMDKIAVGLERDGVLTGAGKTKWHTSTINKILRNEKYIGDALLQKTYTTDFLNKTRVKNNGIVPQYYVENDHEAIIPRDIFMRVQEELVRRSSVKPGPNGKKHTYSCNHCFSQMIVCGECNEQFRRIHWNNRGCKSIVWRCVSRLEPTGHECHARTVNELELQRVVVAALNELLGDREGYQRQLQQNIAAVIHASATASTDAIDEKLLALQQELLKKAHNKEAYDEIADEIFRLRELKQQTAVDTVARDDQIKRITALEFIIAISL